MRRETCFIAYREVPNLKIADFRVFVYGYHISCWIAGADERTVGKFQVCASVRWLLGEASGG